MKLIDLIPTVRHQRERIAQLEQQLAELQQDGRMKLRSLKEILEAYGLLSGFLRARPDSIRIEPEALSDFEAIKDALCWVMQHQYPTITADYLESLRKRGCTVQIVSADDVDISTLTNIINRANGAGESQS